MATPSSFTPAAASSFKAFTPPLHSQASLARAINVLWGLSVAYFTACAAYCTYKLYTAYQCYQHTSFYLPDELKLVKCHALILEAAEKKAAGENVQPLLQECESLLNSITDRFCSYGKGTLLIKLAQHYVTTDPEHAYSISQRLTSSDQLFEAAQSIQKDCPHFDRKKLDIVYERVVVARQIEVERDAKHLKESKLKPRENSIRDVQWGLKLAEAFHFVGNKPAKDTCVNQAWIISSSFKEPLTRISALCQIAECSSQIEDQRYMQQSVAQAKSLLSNILPEQIVQARLCLAQTYLALGDDFQMEEELRKVHVFFNENPTQIHKDLYLYSKSLSTFSKDPKYNLGFKSSDVQPLILEARKAVDKLNLPVKDQANVYLNIAQIFQENLVVDTESEERIKQIAHAMIINLPIDSAEDRNSKIDLLISLGSFYKQQPERAKVVLEHLELLYASCPLKSKEIDKWDKTYLGIIIVKFYNEMNMEVESNAFFQKYTSDLISKKDKKAFKKFNQLTSTARVFRSNFSQDQRSSLLQAAGRLLPELSSNERKACYANVASGYLSVDREKSLTLLRDWESSQARSSAITAVVTAALIGTTYFYPGVTPLLLLGVAVLRLR